MFTLFLDFKANFNFLNNKIQDGKIKNLLFFILEAFSKFI